MSGVSNWIKQQRKGELIELADSIGLKHYDGMKKTELEVALEDFLLDNASRLSHDTRFTPFYNRKGGSPVKKEPSSVLSDTESKRPTRRRNKVAEEILENNEAQTTDESESEQGLANIATALTRTPRAGAVALAQTVPLPPSPAIVADVIDRRTAVIRSKVNDYYKDSGITETVELARDSVSNVVALEFLILLSEALQLQPALLANKYAFTIPAFAALGTSNYAVKVPDLFLLLTASFWNPFTLWLSTNLLVPLFASYFFNLTNKPSARNARYSFDPLTFNIVKGLLALVIYGQDATFGGIVDLESVARINAALYGGFQSVLLGSGIGILVTMYDAVLKK